MSNGADDFPDETQPGIVEWTPGARERSVANALLGALEDDPPLTLSLDGQAPPSERLETDVPPPIIDAGLPAVGTFGRFDVLGRIAFGGMAEVFLGREETSTGVSRFIAIKRILRHVAEDELFVGMFLDEARLAIQLSHPNICHIYEFGELEGSTFIAMEWVNGVPLARLARRAARDEGLPVEIAVKIVCEIADALAYAHGARNTRGQPLEIVHRDVSPHNIMVAYDGHVKLLDFGVAKATSQASKTEAGTLKGKFSYMAPEQCLGADLDGRVDVFALGICLWEALAGRPLYTRENEFETMKAIVEGVSRPLSQERDDVPEELDRIVQKALTTDRDARYRTAGEFQAALEGWLAQTGRFVNAAKIAEFMEALYSEEIRRGPVLESPDFVESIKPVRPASELMSEARDSVGDLGERTKTHRIGGHDYHGEHPASGVPSELGKETAPFFGREEDLSELRRRLDLGHQLITIVGLAGVGKTRLSRELARTEASRSGRRAWFCDLSESSSEADICGVVVHALDIKGAPEPGPALVARVSRHLAALGDALLVIDNFEQVVEHGPATVAVWMSAAPNARFVITSRVRLELEGEVAHGLSPLGPTAAAALWQDRVGLVMPGYRVENEDSGVLQDVLDGLDRLPLAIELAAARMRVMGLRDVRERLSERLALLSGGARNRRENQTSLEAALLWSWRQLETSERSALSQLTVFRGGFDLAAATEILEFDVPDDEGKAPAGLDVMHSLVDKSLLVVRTLEGGPGERRFSFLRTVRDFVVSRDEHDPAGASARHANYFVEFAERWVAHWQARTDERALPVLQRERENLLAAATRASGDPVLALRAALASQPVAGAWGPIKPQLELVCECLDNAMAVGAIPAHLEARALLIRGRLQLTTHGISAAETDWRRALELAVSVGDRTLEGRALHGVATAAHVRGEISAALAGYEQALEVLRVQPHRRALGRALLDSCMLYEITGEPSLALDRVEEAQVAAGSVSDDLAAAVRASHGSVHLELGDFRMARESFERALGICRERGYRLLEGQLVGDLGVTSILDSTSEIAVEQLGAAVHILEEVGDQRMVCVFSGYLAIAHHLAGRSEDASLRCDVALRDARALGFQHFVTYFGALSVMIRADRGRVESARRRFDAELRDIDGDTDPVNATVANLALAQIELARARETSREGDHEHATTHLAAANSLAEAAAHGVTSNRKSRDTRIARRLYAGSLAATIASLGVVEAP